MFNDIKSNSEIKIIYGTCHIKQSRNEQMAKTDQLISHFYGKQYYCIFQSKRIPANKSPQQSITLPRSSTVLLNVVFGSECSGVPEQEIQPLFQLFIPSSETKKQH